MIPVEYFKDKFNVSRKILDAKNQSLISLKVRPLRIRVPKKAYKIFLSEIKHNQPWFIIPSDRTGLGEDGFIVKDEKGQKVI